MKSIIIQMIPVALFFSFAMHTIAQEPEEDKKKDGSGFAGPDQVERQLQDDNEAKESFSELDFIKPYFDFKKNLKENSGFNYGLDYTAAYFSADKSMGESSAGSGMVRLYGSWDLIGKGEGNAGFR